MPHLVLSQNMKQAIRFTYPGGVILISPFEDEHKGRTELKLSIEAPEEVQITRIENVRFIERESDG